MNKSFLKSSVTLKKKVPINDTMNLNIKLEGVGRITDVRTLSRIALSDVA